MTSIKKIKQNIFRSPQGEKLLLIHFAAAVVFTALYILSDQSLFAISMAAGSLIQGCAEFLPEQRNIIAGGMRIAAILIYTGLLVTSFIQPGVLY